MDYLMTCTGGSPGTNWFRKDFPKEKLEVGLGSKALSLARSGICRGLASAIGNLLCRLELGSLQCTGINPYLRHVMYPRDSLLRRSLYTMSAHRPITFHVCDF